MIDQLLNDVSPIIAGYLTYLDVINLSCTCNQVHSQISLNVTSPRPLLSEFSSRIRSDGVRHGFKLPVIVQVPVHSMLISMTWSDQGWGNRKGRIFLVAEKTNITYGSPSRNVRENPCIAYDRSSEFSGRRVVFSSDLAPRGEEELKITFQPRERETYHLFYVVGGGGGHSLHLKDVKMQTLLFGDSSRRLVKAHDFLARSNVSQPWDGEGFQADAMKTIVASTSYSITHGLRILPPILSFFDGRGISEADLTGDKGGQLMDTIESLWNDWEQEQSDYSSDNIANDDEHVMDDNIYDEDDDSDDSNDNELQVSFYHEIGDVEIDLAWVEYEYGEEEGEEEVVIMEESMTPFVEIPLTTYEGHVFRALISGTDTVVSEFVMREGQDRYTITRDGERHDDEH